MLSIRKKIVINYYVFLGLALVAQAFFTVLSGNHKIGQNQKLSALDRQRQQLEKEVQNLENEVALNQSMLKQKNNINSADYVEITAREAIHDKQTLALANK